MKLDYVVKLNEQTDLYLMVYSSEYENCQWAGPGEAITWSTLEQVQTVANAIGHGTVGTTKPS
jgi:hypothetical protein